MRLSLDALPRDVDVLHQLVRDLASAMDESRVEVERLRLIIKQFQRAQFGGRSEKLDADQFQLGLDDLDADLARAEARRPASEPAPEPDKADPKPHRAPLPEHLPRSETVLDVPHDACPDCGREMHAAGETTSEMLDWVPAQFRVLRIRRPKWACTDCGTLEQAPAPERAIGKGLATPALLAHVLISRYCDHTPLYRQAQIFARHGVEISRSTLSGWVGGACWWLEPLRDRLAAHVLAGERIFGDDTPLPVLDPGRGRTKTGRLWAYARDDRPWAGGAPPAVVYFYEPDRKAERPAAHLSGFKGILQADGYAGFEKLDGADIKLAACWVHARRKFYEFHEATKSPVAGEALQRIAELYEIEARIRGRPPADRVAVRAAESTPRVDAMHAWLKVQLDRVSGRSQLADAIRYALGRWEQLSRFLTDGRIDLDNNTVERAIRPVALGRKNALFAGSDGGADRWAVVASLVETCKLNGVEPYGWMRDTLAGMVDGHGSHHLDELMPWNVSMTNASPSH